MPVCEIIHEIPGRVRVRTDLLRLNGRTRECLKLFLEEKPGIREIRMNSSCQSVTVKFDPQRWTASTVQQLIRSARPDSLQKYAPDLAPASLNGSNPDQCAIPPELVLSTTAIVMQLMSFPMASFLVPALLARSAVPIFSRAIQALTTGRKLNVDVLDASATTLLSFQGSFGTAAAMVWLVNIADLIRDKTVARSRKALNGVMDFSNRTAWVVRGTAKVQVPADELKVGDLVVIYAGERIPVDGMVESGVATVDQQMLTGEALPLNKQPGERVYAATVLHEGKLYVRTEQTGENTEAAKIVRLIREGAVSETRIQNYAEVFADDLVPVSFLGAASTMVLGRNMQAAASMLIIDYGTGIRVAAPTAVLASMVYAAQRGILIKSGRHLENLAEINAMIFDKTGTLTQGVPQVVKLLSYDGFSEEEVLALAAGAEARLRHPVAEAVIRSAESRGVTVPERESSHYTIGQGVDAVIDGEHVLVGSKRFMIAKHIEIPCAIDADMTQVENSAASALLVARNNKVIGILAYSDPVRPEAADVIRDLRARGIKKIMIVTGDGSAVAADIARRVGIDDCISGVLPKEKVSVIKKLQQEGFKVGMVGDGINDSPALAQADVGIAVSGGVDVARETAHVTMLRGTLAKIPLSIDISRQTISLIQQNWRLIAVPNSVALLLAFTGMLGPAGATLISNGATVVAAVNSLRPLMTGKASNKR